MLRFGTIDSLVLAVSGGADSTALMHLVHAWSVRTGAPLDRVVAVTVDHGLRSGAAVEAAGVARQAAGLGLLHQTLRWDGPKPATGLQSAAREARYSLLHATAIERGGGCGAAILTAHTADDQAETLLMRLARGSDVDGLASIPAMGHIVRPGRLGEGVSVPVVRPLLGVSRVRLVATLAARGIGYVDDPSNSDVRFERVRVRQALVILEGLGINRVALARTAGRMQAAKFALDHTTQVLAERALTSILGVVFEIERDKLAAEPEAIGLRLFRRMLGMAGGAARPAELTAIEEAYQRLLGAGPERLAFTLGGCIVETFGRGEPPCGLVQGLSRAGSGRWTAGDHAVAG